MTFKVGDKVKPVDNEYMFGIVRTIDGSNKYGVERCDRRTGSGGGYMGIATWSENGEEIKFIGKEVTMDKASWGIKYEVSGDPVEFFETRKAADERLKAILQETRTDKNSVYLFEVGKVYKAELPIKYELVAMKK